MNPESNPDGGREIGPVDEFEAIVARWRSEGGVPEWPTTDPLWIESPVDKTVEFEPRTEEVAIVDEQPTRPQPRIVAAPNPEPPPSELSDLSEDEHYLPPEPPPMPPIGPPAVVGAALLTLGLILVITPSWLGLSDVYGLPLGLIALAAGLGWLVLRLWPDSVSGPEREDDGDDGAIL